MGIRLGLRKVVVTSAVLAVAATGISPASAAPGDITKLAWGQGTGPAAGVGMWPSDLAVAPDGLLVNDPDNGLIRSIATDGSVTNPFTVTADQIALSPSGDLFVEVPSALSGFVDIRRIDSGGTMHPAIGGASAYAPAADGIGLADVSLYATSELVVGPSGDVFFSQGDRIFRADLSTGVMHAFAGGGSDAPQVGAAATSVRLGYRNLASDGAGNLYATDYDRTQIVVIDATGTITRVTGKFWLGNIAGLDVNSAGTVLVGWNNGPGFSNGRSGVKAIATDDVVTDYGEVPQRFVPDVGYVGAEIDTVAFGADGAPLAGGNMGLYRLTTSSATRIGGTGSTWCSGGDGGSALDAQLCSAYATAWDAQGNLYIADQRARRVRRVDPAGTITTVAGGGTTNHPADGSAATAADIQPTGLAVDRAGNLYISVISSIDGPAGNLVWRVTAGRIYRFAGGGTSSSLAAEGVPATQKQLGPLAGIAVDSHGNVYLADTYMRHIEMVNPLGIIVTVAGLTSTPLGQPQGTATTGDGGPALTARLTSPRSVAVDGQDAVYFVDDGAIRRIDPTSLTISTVAGTGAAGQLGPDGAAPPVLPAPAALLTATGNGTVYADDWNFSRLMRVRGGSVQTIRSGRFVVESMTPSGDLTFVSDYLYNLSDPGAL